MCKKQTQNQICASLNVAVGIGISSIDFIIAESLICDLTSSINVLCVCVRVYIQMYVGARLMK